MSDVACRDVGAALRTRWAHGSRAPQLPELAGPGLLACGGRPAPHSTEEMLPHAPIGVNRQLIVPQSDT